SKRAIAALTTSTGEISRRAIRSTSSAIPSAHKSPAAGPASLRGIVVIDDGDRVDFDQHLRRDHLRDLEHRRRGWRSGEVLTAYAVLDIEMLDVADEYVYPHDVVQRSTRGGHRALQVVANLPSLLFDVAQTDHLTVGTARRHSGYEHHSAPRRHNHTLGKMPAGCAQEIGVKLFFHRIVVLFRSGETPLAIGDRVRKDADPVDAYLDGVSRFHPDRRCASSTDTAGGSGGDDITGNQPDHRGYVLDDGRKIEDHLLGGGLLHQFTVETARQGER